MLALTRDLQQLDPRAEQLLGDDRLAEAVRYLTGPSISEDDLKTLADAASLTRARLQAQPELLPRVLAVIRAALDARRFPWAAENRAPTDNERDAAVLASAALLAVRRLETSRRMTGKCAQEEAVRADLVAGGLTQVGARRVHTLADAPAAGQFCPESVLGTRKADFVVRLWDNRLLPLECKVSNSSLNSVKRLNNDAAVKAEAWRQDFGRQQVVPAAVLAGVYKLHNLEEAQDRGLAIFWAHDLPALVAWITRTRTP